MPKSAVPTIPKPAIRSDLPKGTVIQLTPEQEVQFRTAGFTRSMIFVVGSPIKDLSLEHPRQETPYQKAKNMRSARPMQSVGTTGTIRPRNLMREFETVSN